MRPVLATIALLGCLGPQLRADTQDLPVSTPEKQGVDSEKLVELCRFLDNSSLDVRSLLIVRNGHRIMERYEQGLTPDHNFYVYSVTKSVTSTLVGIAIDKKLIPSVEVPVVGRFFPDVKIDLTNPRRKHIRLKHLLTMTSGIQWTDTSRSARDAGTDFAKMVDAPDRVAFVLNRQMAAVPGKKFLYSNGDSQLLAAIVARQGKVSVPDFAKRHLFDKLGFRNWEWVWPDKSGLHPGGYGLRLRARDMCKLGQLFLQNGRWHKKQIVSAKWVRAATQDHTKQHYGYQWWTDLPVPGYSSYSASGLKGQYVRVIPKLRMVIAMTARLEISANNKTIDQLIREFIIPAARRRSALPANPKGSRKLLAAISRSRQIKRKSSGLTADDSPRIPPPKPRKPGK